MDFKRTYFQNQISDNALEQLLAQRTPFFLENVDDVDATTASFAGQLRAQGLICQIRNNRRRPYAEEKELAVISLPFVFGVIFFIQAFWQSLKQRLDNPHPHVIIVQTLHALDVRFKRAA